MWSSYRGALCGCLIIGIAVCSLCRIQLRRQFISLFFIAFPEVMLTVQSRTLTFWIRLHISESHSFLVRFLRNHLMLHFFVWGHGWLIWSIMEKMTCLSAISWPGIISNSLSSFFKGKQSSGWKLISVIDMVINVCRGTIDFETDLWRSFWCLRSLWKLIVDTWEQFNVLIFLQNAGIVSTKVTSVHRQAASCQS